MNDLTSSYQPPTSDATPARDTGVSRIHLSHQSGLSRPAPPMLRHYYYYYAPSLLLLSLLLLLLLLLLYYYYYYYYSQEKGSPAHSKKASIPLRAEPGTMQLHTTITHCVVQCMVVSFSLESRLACVVFSMV